MAEIVLAILLVALAAALGIIGVWVLIRPIRPEDNYQSPRIRPNRRRQHGERLRGLVWRA